MEPEDGDGEWGVRDWVSFTYGRLSHSYEVEESVYACLLQFKNGMYLNPTGALSSASPHTKQYMTTTDDDP